MNILLILSTFFFATWILRSILFWVGLWQLKEYRLDRVIAHVRETSQGRQLFFSRFLFLKVVLIFGFIFVILQHQAGIVYQYAVFLLFFLESLLVYKEVFYHRLKRPVFTVKALFITGLTVLIVSGLYMVPFVERSLWFLLLDRLVPFLIFLIVISLSIPTEFLFDFQIRKAQKKLGRYKKLLVIGVTGSYGKSSTKDFIAQILEAKFNVAKTLGTNNTTIGVVHTVLGELQKDTEIFVAEMGAYKKGEIEQICSIVNPRIGVLTAVSSQHLSLFGSIENTTQAKYELIASLPENGLALFNGNNKITKSLFQKTKKKKALYEVLDAFERSSADITAFNIVTKKTSVQFDVRIEDIVTRMETPLIGSHNVENILPGIYIARYVGMDFKEIKKAVGSLQPLSKTMNYLLSEKGAVLIDDTFNTNPDAIKAALGYMQLYKKKKIMVLEPMIELGQDAEREHYEAAKEIGKTCTHLFLTKNNYYKNVLQGIADSGSSCMVRVGSHEDIAAFLKKAAVKDDIIVFEGKEAGAVLRRTL